MLGTITIPRDSLATPYLRVIRCTAIAGVQFLAAISAWSGPIFLGVSTENFVDTPAEVFAGRSAEFVITLSASFTDTPLLNGELAIAAGGLAAPLASNISFPLQRVGEARAGVQRFKFSLDVPAAKRKQVLVLKIKVHPDPSGEWLPLPAVMLSVSPVTWKESIQQFTRQFSSGRLAGSNKLQLLFQPLGIETVELPDGEPANDPSIRVWFAETSDTEFQWPPATRTVGVIFKKNVRGGLELWRPALQSPPCVLVEAGVLDRIDSDPAAQELFERALSMARALIPAPTNPIQSP